MPQFRETVPTGPNIWKQYDLEMPNGDMWTIKADYNGSPPQLTMNGRFVATLGNETTLSDARASAARYYQDLANIVGTL